MNNHKKAGVKIFFKCELFEVELVTLFDGDYRFFFIIENEGEYFAFGDIGGGLVDAEIAQGKEALSFLSIKSVKINARSFAIESLETLPAQQGARQSKKEQALSMAIGMII